MLTQLILQQHTGGAAKIAPNVWTQVL